MTKANCLILFTVFVSFAMFSNTLAQSEPVMYFCEKYDRYEGETGVGDRYSKGPITIMVICDKPLELTSVSIKYDRYNINTGKFDYDKKFYFEMESDMRYVSFFMDEENDMVFDSPGFYRVFLFDEDDKTVASALIEIID